MSKLFFKKFKISSINNDKFKKFMWILLVICLLGCVLDRFQQKSFEELKKGYSMMYENQYEEAADIFEKYLSSHSDIYWSFIKLINGENSNVTKENVKKALNYCELNGSHN